MFAYLYPQETLLSLLCYLSICLVGWIVYKRFFSEKPKEGFTQQKPYLLKQGTKTYDAFYSEIYDELYQPQKYSEFDLLKIIHLTSPTVQKSLFLDIGSGTGSTINQLHSFGYKASGIDLSEAMVAYSNNKYIGTSTQVGDVIADPMLFETHTFSHILCTHYTIYEFSVEKKKTVLSHCFHWLKPGGFMILHLVDRDQFKTIIPSAQEQYVGNKKRVLETMIDYSTFSFRNVFRFPLNTDEVIHSEKFTDHNSDKVRENERTLWMEPKTEILKMATLIGFRLKQEIDYGDSFRKDPHEYLVILEKPLCGDN
jgi:SAM-dependent methyltransferase